MIDKNKIYKTRDGHEARIYATDGYSPFEVHGAYCVDGEWHLSCWQKDGGIHSSGFDASSKYDLIEVRPRLVHCGWCKHEWFALKLPMPMPMHEIAEKMTAMRCPECNKALIYCGPAPVYEIKTSAERVKNNGET